MNVSARTNGLGLAGGNLRSAPMQQHSGGSFWSALSAVCAEKSGGVFTDGSTVRKIPADEEIAALAVQYDPSNMTGAQYRSLLNKLMKMSAITPDECQRMSSYFMDGASPELRGDLTAKLERMPGVARDELEGLTALSEIVRRMDRAVNGMSLLEQAVDGVLWTNLNRLIVENAEKKEKQEQEEEELELLELMLDCLTGEEDEQKEAAAQLRLKTLAHALKQTPDEETRT